MVVCVVTAVGDNKVLATPQDDVNISNLIGKKAVYRDVNDKDWSGMVENIEDNFLVIIFKPFPINIGQGQLIEVEE